MRSIMNYKLKLVSESSLLVITYLLACIYKKNEEK